MTYRSILVHVARSDVHDAAVTAAASLAAAHDALLIGLGAGLPAVMPVADGMTASLVVEVIDEQRAQLHETLTEAEKHFRAAAAQAPSVSWRAFEGSAVDTIAKESRAADLIVLPHPPESTAADMLLPADPGDVLMAAGRPVLLPAAGATTLNPRNVLIAWKDASQTRRAVHDALPLLKRAGTVTVLGVDDTGEEDAIKRVIEDAVAHLSRHGVTATARMTALTTGDAGSEILKVANESGADLIVAGGYGRSRVSEWAFGGVTRTLLQQTAIACLLSH